MSLNTAFDDSDLIQYAASLAARHIIDDNKTNLYEYLWQGINDDINYIENNGDIYKLLRMPLFLGEPPLEWRNYVKIFKLRLGSFFDLTYPNTNWLHWIEWYDDISNGNSPFGLPWEIADNLETLIALGGHGIDSRFWELEPHAINLDVSEWIAEAKAETKRGKHSDDDLDKALGQRVALHQYLDVDGYIVAKPQSSKIESNIFSQTLWFEMKEKLRYAQVQMQRMQVPQHIKDSIGRLYDTMGNSLEEVNPGLLLMRSKTLDSISAAYSFESLSQELSADAVATIADLVESLPDFRALFPEIVQLEAARVAQQIASDKANSVRNSIQEITNLANESESVDETVIKAFQESFDEILESERISKDTNDVTVSIEALEQRANQIALFALDVRNFAARVLKTAGANVIKVTKDAGSHAYRGTMQGIEESSKAASKVAIIALAAKIAGPLTAIAIIIMSFNPLAKKADEIRQEADGENEDN